MFYSLYIVTAHYSILQFLVFFYPLVYMFCLHYVLQVATLQTLDGPSLPSSPLKTNVAIWTHYNCLFLPCSEASSF